MKAWLLGNTTVRSPFRLREGLIALSGSSLQGNLRGLRQDIAFRELLGAHGVVELGEDRTNSVGRKWRSALNKLGFLYPPASGFPNVTKKTLQKPDTITPNGWRLINSNTVPAMQECFLRSLAAVYIPCDDKTKHSPLFSPLRHTLAVMSELDKRTGESRLNFIEMAVILQLTTGKDHVSFIADTIILLRNQRLASSNKRKFDNEQRQSAAVKHNYQAPETLNDYADTNLRYLKATGLVQSKGRGISFVQEKRLFIETLVADTSIPTTDDAMYTQLHDGAALPIDNLENATIVLQDLMSQLKSRGIVFDITNKSVATAADVGILRHDAEKLLFDANEENYALKQVEEWKEIVGYMELLITQKSKKTLPGGAEISVPKSEGPAYFEWVLWRAFLAVNRLTNKPYESRRFNIDQDFLPVGTAPGGGPDLVFEFDDFVIVVEVTLTTSSRQESTEGESVRRHVASLVTYYKEISNKTVYGLFIANKIDSNTAEAFRIGVWYTNTDEKMKLDIVPVTLKQFKDVFEASFKAGKVSPLLFRDLLEQCGSVRSQNEAPEWKNQIDLTVERTKKQILQ